jgi:hypothetical protein
LRIGDAEVMATVNIAIDNLEQWGEQVVRGTLLSLSSAIIKDTPVVSGRLRSNWMPSINAPKLTEAGITSEASKISEVSSTVASFKFGDIFYLTNNLPYAVPIEFGHSKRFPEGMLRRNVAKYAQAIREAAN